MAKKMDLIPVGKTQGVIANGSVATFAFAFVKTQRTSERLKRYMGVAIAPPALEMGLLGQDFFEGYDFTIKENVIEFRLRERHRKELLSITLGEFTILWDSIPKH